MPYIAKEKRRIYEEELEALESRMVRITECSIGELNYILTRICLSYLKRFPKIKYHNINKIMGCLECVKLEFYRRFAAPYEDKKKIENGDVYD